MHTRAVALVLVLALLAGSASCSLRWPHGGADLPEDVDKNLTVLDQRLRALALSMWQEHREKIAYCLGGTLDDVLGLLSASFPSPLPTGPDDGICGDATSIDARLCSPDEIMLFYKVRELVSREERAAAADSATRAERRRHVARPLGPLPPCSTCWPPTTRRRCPATRAAAWARRTRRARRASSATGCRARATCQTPAAAAAQASTPAAPATSVRACSRA
jgi:hypothetical protein